MDEYSTPLTQLQNDQPSHSGSQPPINYSDMLQSIESQKQSQHTTMPPEQQPNQVDYPPPPIVQSRLPMNTNMNFITPAQQHNVKMDDNNDANMSQFQKDIMYILIPSILLYSTPVQNHMLRLIPSLFKEDKPTIIGNILNGSIIAFIYIALKSMKVNFT